MNIIDATALPMFECFTERPSSYTFNSLKNRIIINQLNPALSSLKGPAMHYAKFSSRREYDRIDGGNDDVMNRILWYALKGIKNIP